MIGRSRELARWTAAVLLALFPASCYTYRPAPETPSPGSSVRVRLSARGALEMSDATDEARRTYEGDLVGAARDTVTISMLQSRAQAEFDRRRTLRNHLSIPRAYVEALEQRTLSTARTSLVIAGGAALIGAMIVGLTSGGDGGSPDDGGPNGPVLIRIP